MSIWQRTPGSFYLAQPAGMPWIKLQPQSFDPEPDPQPQSEPRNERWGTALHEAGHAVADYALGFDILSINIDDDGLAGRVETRVGGSSPWRRAIVLLCGPVSEHGGERAWEDLFESGWRSDNAETDLRQIDELGSAGVDIEACLGSAIQLVDRFSESVELVARMLYKYGSMRPDTLRHVDPELAFCRVLFILSRDHGDPARRNAIQAIDSFTKLKFQSRPATLAA